MGNNYLSKEEFLKMYPGQKGALLYDYIDENVGVTLHDTFDMVSFLAAFYDKVKEQLTGRASSWVKDHIDEYLDVQPYSTIAQLAEDVFDDDFRKSMADE